MFSQRHYVAIADLLKETGFDNPHLVEAFCGLFAKDNDRFKPERFKKAVGFDEFVQPTLSMKIGPPEKLGFQFSNETTMRHFVKTMPRNYPGR